MHYKKQGTFLQILGTIIGIGFFIVKGLDFTSGRTIEAVTNTFFGIIGGIIIFVIFFFLGKYLKSIKKKLPKFPIALMNIGLGIQILPFILALGTYFFVEPDSGILLLLYFITLPLGLILFIASFIIIFLKNSK